MEEDSSYLRYNFQQKGSINMVMSKGRRRRRKSIRFGRIVGVIIALLAIILLFLPLSMEDKTIEVEVGTE